MIDNVPMTTQTKQSDAHEQLLAFGQAFKRAYEQAGLSKRAVAAAVPLDRSAIGKIEKGLRGPKFETLLKLARAAKTTPAALLGHTSAQEERRAVSQPTVGQAAKRFGENLRRAREAVEGGMTQEDLAFYAKVDRSAVSGYETGRVAPGVETTIRLAEALKVPPGALLRGVALSSSARQRLRRAGRDLRRG
jgi:transcriptional regulator with XRE-family HTH domain